MKENRKHSGSKPLPPKVREMINPPADSDPLGSYTGKPKDGDRPIQDADDI